MVAGIAAMLVAAMLGSAMRLNNTAVVMSSCVVRMQSIAPRPAFATKRT